MLALLMSSFALADGAGVGVFEWKKVLNVSSGFGDGAA
jgi:hypothetical protein